MYCWLQRRWLLAASLSLATGLLLQASSAAGADFKRVKFQTVDSVEIQGTFYSAGGAKRKDTCVILLHAIHPQKGGTSHDGSWDSFAGQLQKSGYEVLSFDFRGFGASTSVGPEFWDAAKFPHNQRWIRGAHKKPESISFKDFQPNYYPYLANDVAAARSYLNERGDVNTSNLVLVGAGEGATLGLMWMAAECRLQRDTASDQPIRLQVMLDPDPEGRDLACGIWLNISPTLAGNIRVPIDSLARDVARRGKVRQAFLASKSDTVSAPLARRYADMINQGLAKDRRLATAELVARAGQLTGSKLLGDNLDAAAWITDECLPSVLDKRGSRDRRKHDMERYGYFWVFPWPNEAGARPVTAKDPKEIMLRPLPIGNLLGRGG